MNRRESVEQFFVLCCAEAVLFFRYLNLVEMAKAMMEDWLRAEEAGGIQFSAQLHAFFG